jgi:hypothetical protein
MAYRQAKLYVGFDFPCVQGAVEKSKFNCPLGEGAVKVKAVVPAVVVVAISAFTAVILVPDIRQGINRLGLFLIYGGNQFIIDFFAISKP